MPVYLDANATEPLRPKAREAAWRALEETGNPASVHAHGRAARAILENARTIVAKAFGREADSVVFTSGGTEADSLAVHALGRAHGRRLIVCATEHATLHAALLPGALLLSGRQTEAGAQDAVLPVDESGLPDLVALKHRLAPSKNASEPFVAPLVCVMAANNETGVRAPLAEIARLCREAGAPLHIDAVQAAGRLPWGAEDWNEEALKGASLAISGHKMGGLMGAGALILPHDRPLTPLQAGGGQERGRRGGTPALPAIAAMAAALEESRAQDWAEIEELRDALERTARTAGAMVAGAAAPRLPNTLSLIFPGVPAQTQLMALDLAGFCVSAGSACSSGKVAASHVLEAMGFGAGAGHAIRVSLPWNVKPDDVRAFGEAYVAMATRLGKSASSKNPRNDQEKTTRG